MTWREIVSCFFLGLCDMAASDTLGGRLILEQELRRRMEEKAMRA